MFDLSSFYWLNLADEFTFYKQGETESIYNPNRQFYYVYAQSRKILLNKDTAVSLNIVIGQIGGYTALIWLLITFIFDGYENFKLNSSLMDNLYTLTLGGEKGPFAHSPRSSRTQLKNTFERKDKNWYTYREFLFLRFLRKFCCGCYTRRASYLDRKLRYESYMSGQKKLHQELSLSNLISTMRLTKFIADLMKIQDYQKLLVNMSRIYQVQALEDTRTFKLDTNDQQPQLNGRYFSEKLLENIDEQTPEWLLEQISDKDSRDQALIKAITGFDHSKVYQDFAINHEQDFAINHEESHYDDDIAQRNTFVFDENHFDEQLLQPRLTP